MDSRKIETTVITPFMEDEWKTFERVDETEMSKAVATGVSKELLDTAAQTITSLPSEFKFFT